MLIKDKDILEDVANNNVKQSNIPARRKIDSKNMKSAWGDAFDYYLRGITSNYLHFSGRASRLEFWGFSIASSIILCFVILLGVYAEIPMLVYYYIAATFIPFIAIMTRRLHDTNKKSWFYLSFSILTLCSYVFIGFWAILVFLIWSLILVKILSLRTEEGGSFYGDPTNDEIYGDDNDYIIKKFRMLSILFFALFLSFSITQFDVWSTNIVTKSNFDTIIDEMDINASKYNLTEEQLNQAKDIMKKQLAKWNGQEISEDEVYKAIDASLQAVRN